MRQVMELTSKPSRSKPSKPSRSSVTFNRSGAESKPEALRATRTAAGPGNAGGSCEGGAGVFGVGGTEAHSGCGTDRTDEVRGRAMVSLAV